MGAFGDKVKENYKAFFQTTWSPMTGGIVIAFLCVFMVAWHRPFGIVGGIRNWADWLFYSIGLFHAWKQPPPHPLYFSSSVIDIGFLAGAWISAVIGKEFAFRVPPVLELIKGFFSGILMGLGAAFAFGCNVGGFYSATQNLAANGLVMFIGLICGVAIGLKYLFWEMEHIPAGPPGPTLLDKKIPPAVGFIAILIMIIAAFAYTNSSKSGADLMAGYLLIGGAIGFVFQRSRFCMVNGFREPFMTGDARMGKAVAISVIIGTLGIAIIKYMGLRPEMLYVTPCFWWGALIGGFIFGMGMVVAGGCGTGSLWRVGEGQVKLIVVATMFALSNSIFRYYFTQTGFLYKLGKPIYLPDYLGYGGSVILITIIMILWYLIIDWNEETNKFVYEI